MANWAHITGPRECHGVTSADEYLAAQRTHLVNLHRSGRSPLLVPSESREPATPLVSAGRSVMMCDCGNAPSVSHEWSLACCFDCGAVYRTFKWPKDRVKIEAALVPRPVKARNWERPETVADLRAENIREMR